MTITASYAIMINEIEKKTDQIQDEEDIDKIISIVAAPKNSCFLQQDAIAYNLGDGMGLSTMIANDEYCDLGRVLAPFR